MNELFTPGPWKVTKAAANGSQPVIENESGQKAIARIYDYDTEAAVNANAALIAAAPRLLEALRKVLNCPDVNFDELEPETEEATAFAWKVIKELEGGTA